MKILSIKYLKSENQDSESADYENFWFEQIQRYFIAKGFEVKPKIISQKKTKNTIKWFFGFFWQAKADIVIVNDKNALPILLRNLFYKRKVIVVSRVLNFKELEKNRPLFLYYSLIFKFIKLQSRFYIVAASHYWKALLYDKTRIPIERILLLPSLFDPEDYNHFQVPEKPKNIHLGRWTTKLDKTLYDIASHLSHRGYYCFFTTPEDIVAMGAYGYEIIYCPTPNEYKSRVANALYTLIIPSKLEGWSKIAHESFLLGTPVIGFDSTDLGELIYEAGGYLAKSIQEVIEIIESDEDWNLSENFKQKFHSNKAQEILKSYGL